MKVKMSKLLLTSFLVFGLTSVVSAVPIENDIPKIGTVDECVRIIKEFRANSQSSKRLEKHQEKIVRQKTLDGQEKVARQEPSDGKPHRDNGIRDGRFTICKQDNDCDKIIPDRNNHHYTGKDCPTDGNTNPVPEPATMLLFGAGIAGIAGTRLRKKKK